MQSASVDNETLTALSEPFLGANRKMPSEGSIIARKASIIVAVLLTLTGVGLTIAALLLPSWQVVHLFEYNSIHEHGLWLDCMRYSRSDIPLMRRHETISEPLNCVYKWDYDETLGTMGDEDPDSPVGEVNRHRFYGWQVATMILLGLSLITSLLSICVGCCAFAYRYLALVFAAINLLTACVTIVAECLFFFYSHRADNRFINGIVGTYEQKVGLAFFLELGACIAHLVAFLITVLAAFFAFSRSPTDEDQFSVDRISKSTGPNIQRTMEVDPPLLFQQTTGASIVRSPPHYTKFQSSYSKTPAASMPELLPSPVRRGSETCV
ncbi:Clc-like protein 2 [Toxocara canis]|uniref:Clc-like protein 2 n=1 Tax=Toxocara canis TaxID=6265 RepID=A0A0B2UQC9_TOXCA|nr:Clc-like protein 2 [Toxocara canis]